MASEVSICSAALRKLGHSPITALGEDSKAGRIANERYAELRDELIYRHPWNFATKRQSIPVSATSPAWGFANAFPLPVDYLRMREVNGEDETSGKWKVEGKSVVTDLAGPLEILFTYQVTDTNFMSPTFREALASILAADWAEDLTGDDDVVRSTSIKARFAVAQARSNDGQEGIPDSLEADEWLNAHL